MNESTAPLGKIDQKDDEATIWSGEFRAPLEEFRGLQSNCQLAAYFKFARAPYWLKRDNGIVVGDLRFDREKGLGFSEIFFAKGSEANCPTNLPPWNSPRADLLQEH